MIAEISGQEIYSDIKADRKTLAVHDSSIPHTNAVKADPIQQEQRLSGRLIPLSGRPLVIRLAGWDDGEIQSTRAQLKGQMNNSEYQPLGSSPSANLFNLAPAAALTRITLRLIV